MNNKFIAVLLEEESLHHNALVDIKAEDYSSMFSLPL